MFCSDDVLNTKLGPHRRRELILLRRRQQHHTCVIWHTPGVSREETILIRGLLQLLKLESSRRVHQHFIQQCHSHGWRDVYYGVALTRCHTTTNIDPSLWRRCGPYPYLLLATPAVGAQQSNSGMDNQEAIHQLTVINKLPLLYSLLIPSTTITLFIMHSHQYFFPI